MIIRSVGRTCSMVRTHLFNPPMNLKRHRVSSSHQLRGIHERFNLHLHHLKKVIRLSSLFSIVRKHNHFPSFVNLLPTTISMNWRLSCDVFFAIRNTRPAAQRRPSLTNALDLTQRPPVIFYFDVSLNNNRLEHHPERIFIDPEQRNRTQL